MTEAGARPAAAADGFRSDINGLRAISIAAVVAFHLTNGAAPGGFVGVDVFFVISGYLMTRIILGRLEAGGFRLGAFYLARLRRIGPALAALCAGLWLFGALLLDPWTFQSLAVKLPSALLFVSNIMFASRGGYFAEDSAGNWFLHTWSLSVEWQFYLLHPLLLITLFAWRSGRRRIWLWLAMLALASFALAVALPPRYWILDFYLLPTRAWELLAGALCVAAERRFAPGPRGRALLHVGGLMLIAAGVAAARPGGHWPAMLTLAPVCGGALVIISGLRKTWWAENRLVDGVGRASYSIYVWHWPIVVWLHRGAIAITWPVALAALAGMLGLGAASYWLIERRLTDWLFRPRPIRWRFGVAATVVVLALAGAAATTHGLEALRTLAAPAAVKAAMVDDRHAADDWTYPRVCGRFARQGRMELCQLGDGAARQVLVIGDSHAQQLTPRYAHAFDGRRGLGLTVASIPGCIPVPHVSERGSAFCGRAWADAYRYAESAGFARVVIVSNWATYFEPSEAAPVGLTQIDWGAAPPAATPSSSAAQADAVFRLLADEVRRLQAHGATVSLIGTTPEASGADPRLLYARAFWRGELVAPPLIRSQCEQRAALARQRLAWLSQTTGAAVFDPLDGLCTGGLCPVMEGGRTLFKDQGHFRASMMTSARFAYLDPWVAPATPIRLK